VTSVRDPVSDVLSTNRFKGEAYTTFWPIGPALPTSLSAAQNKMTQLMTFMIMTVTLWERLGTTVKNTVGYGTGEVKIWTKY